MTQHLTQELFRLAAHYAPVLGFIFLGVITANGPDYGSSYEEIDDWYFDESNKDGFYKGKD